MIWVHCGSVDEVAVTRSLVSRLLAEDDADDIVVTATAGFEAQFHALPDGATFEPVPAEAPNRARAFLNTWLPDFLIWIGGALRPVLLKAVDRAGVNAVLINAQVDGIIAGSARWIPGAARNAVQAFDEILTLDGATATRLRRGGVQEHVVRAVGPILEEPVAPPVDRNELAVMAEAIGTRPSWFAARAVPVEIKDLAAAHLAASRKSHRMILLVTPMDLESGTEVADILREAGLNAGVRSAGDAPTTDTQAYVADLPGEIGLWCRIAPVTYIGGTLRASARLSPLAPISVGSVVVHGTRKAPHETRFFRLSQAEAAREVRSAGELGIAVGSLSSPDRSAQMALSGWEEITRNANILNSIIGRALGRPESIGAMQ